MKKLIVILCICFILLGTGIISVKKIKEWSDAGKESIKKATEDINKNIKGKKNNLLSALNYIKNGETSKAADVLKLKGKQRKLFKKYANKLGKGIDLSGLKGYLSKVKNEYEGGKG
ncbi:MAG: hypothetical protein LBD41_04550 [Clostridiales Family XIII bacterium]|nr:hypothetical protein [Clostridiales Family XIII bacterium]